MPVLFMFLFSVEVLNRNLAKWFSMPAEGVQFNFVQISNILRQQQMEKANAQAALLAADPAILNLFSGALPAPPDLARLCSERDLIAMAVLCCLGSEYLVLSGPWGDAGW